MIEIINRKNICLVKIPSSVCKRVSFIAGELDANYREDRDPYNDLGGYIVIIEEAGDYDLLKEKVHIEGIIPEYVDLISVEEGEDYTCSLFLLSCDYAIVVFAPLSLTPEHLLEQMV